MSSSAFLPAPLAHFPNAASSISARSPTRPRRVARRASPRLAVTPSSPPATAVANFPYAPPSPDPSQRVRVVIHAPASDRRVITASNIIHAPLPIVWTLLSDYGHLADHIPNLQTSRLRTHPTGGIRLEQCGAQSIFGFTFRASLVMDMVEHDPKSDTGRAIQFSLVTSQDFNEFRGEWRMERLADNKTALYYTVEIVPKGLVPVRAIEWRISEDVPGNMDAVRTECERRRRVAVAQRRQTSNASLSSDQPPSAS